MVDTAELRSPWLSRSGLHRHCVTIGPGLGSEWWSWEGPLTEIACQQNGLDIEDSEETLAGIKELVKAHLQAPRQQRAPARFFALLYTWKHLHVTWSEEVEQKLNSLEAGVGKLKEAGEQVAKLEDEVSKQRQELEVYVNVCNDVWSTDFSCIDSITSNYKLGIILRRFMICAIYIKTQLELLRFFTDIFIKISNIQRCIRNIDIIF